MNIHDSLEQIGQMIQLPLSQVLDHEKLLERAEKAINQTKIPGEQLRDGGAAKVLSRNRHYLAAFFKEADWQLSFRDEFTSEDVTERMLIMPTHPNAVGAAIRAFAKANGLIVVGHRKATRPSAHARMIQIWGRKI